MGSYTGEVNPCQTQSLRNETIGFNEIRQIGAVAPGIKETLLRLDSLLGVLSLLSSKMEVETGLIDLHIRSPSTSHSEPRSDMCKTNRSGKSSVITREQLEHMCSNLPLKYSILADLLYFSAGRVNEITTLKVRNFNERDGLIVIEKSSTKTKETRSVPIHPRVVEELKSWIKSYELKDDDYIFFTDSKNTKYKKGEKSISTQSVDQYFRKTFDWIGVVGGSTHSFRRSRLTHLLQEGWHLREIMDISGHKNLVSLQQYLDSDRKETFSKYRELFKNE